MRASARAAVIYNSSSTGKLGLLVLRNASVPSLPSLRGGVAFSVIARGVAFSVIARGVAPEAISMHRDRHAPAGLAMTDGSHCEGAWPFSVIARSAGTKQSPPNTT